MKITGFDELNRQLEEAQKAIAELNGDLGVVSFDPHDAASLEAAIQRVSDIIDEKLGPYADNSFVASLIEETKEQYRVGIWEQAAAARLGSMVNNIEPS